MQASYLSPHAYRDTLTGLPQGTGSLIPTSYSQRHGEKTTLREFPSGLSPRVRGNRRWGNSSSRGPGSIPACTGEPSPGRWRGRGDGVYPRVYGGTLPITLAVLARAGLSAWASFASRPSGGGPRARVYPRVYGGTFSWVYGHDQSEGLSPRVRGNRRHDLDLRGRARSIPACTGEPVPVSINGLSPTVYPRVYGGTTEIPTTATGMSGLSPRVRGNLRRQPCSGSPHGSIPACTGEPARLRTTGSVRRVYPRVYGGTADGLSHEEARTGLSPRVRGNRTGRFSPAIRAGSIPACTGEPGAGYFLLEKLGVYPRVYGGT